MMVRQRKDRPPVPSATGWQMRYGGAAGVVRPAPEFRGTTNQVCGLWPFTSSTGLPLVGVPIGQHTVSGATVCSDPISWFDRKGLIANPSLLVLGRAALGKSSLVRRMALGLAAFGVNLLAPGDLKPDFSGLVHALDGSVQQVGRGRGAINVVDGSATFAVARRLTGSRREWLIEDSRLRRLHTISTLIEVNRRAPVSDTDEGIIGAALSLLDARRQHGDEPTLIDLMHVIREAPDELRLMVEVSNDDDYHAEVRPLLRSIRALANGALGTVFAQKTTVPMDITRPMSIDISAIPEADVKLSAAVLAACWGEAFAAIQAYHELVDAGLEEPRNWIVILDELWRVLGAGEHMVKRVDALTRLDRNTGVGTVMVTHNTDDAAGAIAALAKRAGYFAFGGQTPAEVPNLARLTEMSRGEMDIITQWSAPEGWGGNGDQRPDPPGVGCFLIKVGSLPGIPVRVLLTPDERRTGDTNFRWEGARYKPAPDREPVPS